MEAHIHAACFVFSPLCTPWSVCMQAQRSVMHGLLVREYKWPPSLHPRALALITTDKSPIRQYNLEARETMVIHVGRDVHKYTSLFCFEPTVTAERRFCASVSPLQHKEYAPTLNRARNEKSIFKCGYEAGCLGFSFSKELWAYGYDCYSSDSTCSSKRANA